MVLGVGKGALFREVSSVQKCLREWFHCTDTDLESFSEFFLHVFL